MKMLFAPILIIILILNNAQAQIRLPQLIRDSMVLQRDTRIKIWGWASSGEELSIKFNRHLVEVKAGTDGKWIAFLPPMGAGGPYRMELSGKNKITLNDVLIGDVWLCSGQSNMVHQMVLHNITYAQDIKDANYPQIRHFWIPAIPSLDGPEEDLPTGYWNWANKKDVNQFSAVAYFFAKKIYEKYHIPIGLINASVGGTPIEAWTSEEGLKDFPELTASILMNKDTSYINNLNRTALARRAAVKEVQDKGMLDPKWYDENYVPKNWQTINIPGYWEDQGVKDLDGVVWYRKEIDVPVSMTGIEAMVFLGRIVDADILYINGQSVATTGYQYPQRRYRLNAGVLKPGKNVFVIRVTNTAGKGGFVPGKPYYIKAGEQTLDLKGYWQYKVGAVYSPAFSDREPRLSTQNFPAALYNGMVAPTINYGIKGVLWYQGESNEKNASEYKRLLPALISDWRNKRGQGAIPFLYVQLPNFMDVDYLPSESNWALLREAALKTLVVPNTGMAVTIDLGEWNDIHPDNKKDVGERLALAALKIAYKEKETVSGGPLYQSAKIQGNKIVVNFTQTGGGLITIDNEALSHFAVAGADKKFVWSQAKIEGDKVVVWNEEIPAPRYVRYAWADNPFGANLYNKEKLPASPFRTDE